MTGPPGSAPHDSEEGAPRQVVTSAEQVALHLAVAGPTTRMLAYAIDWLLLWVLLVALFVVVVLGSPLLDWLVDDLRRWVPTCDVPEPDGPTLALGLGILLVVQVFGELLYFVFWELTTNGRSPSPGKAALGLRVVCDGGQPLTPSASLLRNLLRFADALPFTYLVGFVAMLVSREGKRLGDLAAGTLVVRLDRAPLAAPVEPDAGSSPFRFSREQLARVGRPERTLLRQTLRRAEALPRERAEEVLERAVDVLCARIGFAGDVPPSERRAFLAALLVASGRRRDG